MTIQLPPNTFGFDACVPLNHVAASLAASDYTMVGRYIAPGADSAWKVVTPAEAVTLAIAGICLFPIFESSGDPRGVSQGRSDGSFALGYLPTIGLMPDTGVVVMYTEDRDTEQADLPPLVAAFQGFGSALGSGYGVGAYAGGFACTALSKAALIKIIWLTQSQGFNGTKEAIAAGDYHMIQRLGLNIAVGGRIINVDPDSLRQPDTDIGARVPWGGKVPAGARLDVYAVHMLLQKAGFLYDVLPGSETKRAVKLYLADRQIRRFDWDSAIPHLLNDAAVQIAS